MRVAALILSCVGAVLAAWPAQSAAQAYVGQSAESPADGLARHLKVLATSPRNFNALIGAGKAALAMGDTQAAAGFFGRAEEVWPSSPMPQIGMGAALAHEGEGASALQYFARAAQMGAAPVALGAERGLAYDLLGQHAQAQADYRAAMGGPDHEEARRRLSLSLAITGDKAEALTLLSPLMAKGDPGAARVRAFVLALTGDAANARAAIDAAMPGSSSRMDYFFRRLPSLRSSEKAAAVHLGLFPGPGTELASAPSAPPSAAAPPAAAGDRLSSIDQLLSARSSTAPAVAQQQVPQQQPVQTASATAVPTRPATPAAAPTGSAGQVYFSPRIWLQLASGRDANALPDQYRRIRARGRDLFEGVSGYVVEEAERARLLIGPFRNAEDADIFADDLAALRLDAFRWTNPPGQIIRKLPPE